MLRQSAQVSVVMCTSRCQLGMPPVRDEVEVVEWAASMPSIDELKAAKLRTWPEAAFSVFVVIPGEMTLPRVTRNLAAFSTMRKDCQDGHVSYIGGVGSVRVKGDMPTRGRGLSRRWIARSRPPIRLVGDGRGCSQAAKQNNLASGHLGSFLVRLSRNGGDSSRLPGFSENGLKPGHLSESELSDCPDGQVSGTGGCWQCESSQQRKLILI